MTTKLIGIGTDHGGFPLKRCVVGAVRNQGLEVLDFGTNSEEPVDYPEFAHKLVDSVVAGVVDTGILLCGTGIGVSIAANRHNLIRAAMCYDTETVLLARQHNDANVLCLGGRKTNEDLAIEMVEIFLSTDFLGGRHTRRVQKISKTI